MHRLHGTRQRQSKMRFQKYTKRLEATYGRRGGGVWRGARRERYAVNQNVSGSEQLASRQRRSVAGGSAVRAVHRTGPERAGSTTRAPSALA
ncbi:hypothetical protein EVAR_84819_1 [Eumeta japonica]|uniref:Uncharacterized protein n=1 Tax=Eumeta variegata TaxID=151549 RepID=A0A4C1U8D6_EUMVA|nr:hypothetical protein EVAR_84819_1 [Eumeta japonica]